MESSALYTVNLPHKEYIPLIEDISRMIIVQITIQFLYYINNKEGDGFLTIDFILLLVYIVLGVCIYWLIFRRSITFV